MISQYGEYSVTAFELRENFDERLFKFSDSTMLGAIKDITENQDQIRLKFIDAVNQFAGITVFNGGVTEMQVRKKKQFSDFRVLPAIPDKLYGI